jgi:threonyl-tRNA synthetase
MLVVGDREQSDGAVAVRSHSQGDLGSAPTDEFIARAAEQIATRSGA